MFLFIIAIYVHLPHPALNDVSPGTHGSFGIDECVWNEETKVNQCILSACTVAVVALRRKLVNLACAWDVPIYPFQ